MERLGIDVEKILNDDKVLSLGKNGVSFYLTLKCYCWLNGSIPRDLASLVILLRTEKDLVQPMYEKLIFLFSEGENNRLVDKDVENYRTHITEQKEKRINKARNAANARHQRNKESHTETAKRNEKYKDEIKIIWNYFFRRFKKNKNYLCNKSRISLIRKALERGWSVAHITQAIDNFSKDDWFKSNTNLDIRYVLRVKSGEDKVEKFLGKKQTQTELSEVGSDFESKS